MVLLSLKNFLQDLQSHIFTITHRKNSIDILLTKRERHTIKHSPGHQRVLYLLSLPYLFCGWPSLLALLPIFFRVQNYINTLKETPPWKHSLRPSLLEHSSFQNAGVCSTGKPGFMLQGSWTPSSPCLQELPLTFRSCLQPPMPPPLWLDP